MQTVTVPLGPCQCPGAPHEKDTIDLRARLDFVSGRALQALLFVLKEEGLGQDMIVARLAAAYLEHGVVGWNLVGENGPIPLNPANLDEHVLSDFTRAQPVADAADELYAPVVIHPLVNAAGRSSPSTTTAASTSAMNGGGPKRSRKHSKRSSTSTTPMADTAETSE